MSGEYENGYIAAIKESVLEVKGWRELTILAYRECPTTDPELSQRECQNKLNLLDVIISKLRKKAGEDPATVFNDMRNWDRVGYPQRK